MQSDDLEWEPEGQTLSPDTQEGLPRQRERDSRGPPLGGNDLYVTTYSLDGFPRLLITGHPGSGLLPERTPIKPAWNLNKARV